MIDLSHRPLRTLADIVAFESEKPLNERLGARSVHDVFVQSAARFPNRVAVSMLMRGDPDEPERDVTTYPMLLEGINRAANLFASLGGNHPGVAYLLPSLVETFFTLWGAETAGYAVPINFLLSPTHIADIVRQSGARILVALGPHPQLNIWEKAVAVSHAVPGLTLLQVAFPGAPPGNFTTALRDQDGARLRFGPARCDDQVAAYHHTGGTTGTPKLVAHTHRNQLVAAFGGAVLLDYSESDVMPYSLPMFHVAATISNGLAPHMCGTKLLITSPIGMRDPSVVKNTWRLTEKHRLTILGGVPTSLSAQLNVPVDGDLSSVRASFVGAAATPAAVAHNFERHTGSRLHELFGMTEAGGLIAVAPTAATPVIGSVGFRLPYTQASVHRITNGGGLGEVCPPHEIGLLMVSGPTVSPGYLAGQGDPGSFMDGQLNTGDLAYTDEQGRLYIAGRAKDLIIRSGHNIDPRMIEDAIQAHPAVDLSAAVSRPDLYAGEIPVCYVVLKPGVTADIDDIRRFAEAHISERPAWPRHIYIVDSIPMTSVGKISKVELRADAVKRLVGPIVVQAIGVDAVAIDVMPGGRKGMTVEVRLPAGLEPQHRLVEAALEGYLFERRVTTGP